MGLFQRRAARTARPPLARAGLAAAPLGAWPVNYEAQVRAGYVGNAIAQRAVRLVVEALGGAPLAGSDDALTALVAARSGGQALIETVAAHVLLHGRR